jgi:nitric oxide reductase NorD protein
MNKGEDLILTYVQAMPGVAREVGEDIIPGIVSALMKLASHTSGTVITLIMANMPLAASRWGTPRSCAATSTCCTSWRVRPRGGCGP